MAFFVKCLKDQTQTVLRELQDEGNSYRGLGTCYLSIELYLSRILGFLRFLMLMNMFDKGNWATCLMLDALL